MRVFVCTLKIVTVKSLIMTSASEMFQQLTSSISISTSTNAKDSLSVCECFRDLTLAGG